MQKRPKTLTNKGNRYEEWEIPGFQNFQNIAYIMSKVYIPAYNCLKVNFDVIFYNEKDN